MKRLFILLTVTVLAAATADAQETCAKCYWDPWGGVNCGITIYNGYVECSIDSGYVCTLTGSCQTANGECPANRPCAHSKWACGSRLPEKARWSVATVDIRQPKQERAKS